MSGGCRPPTSTAGTRSCPRAPAKRWRLLYYNIDSATGPRGINKQRVAQKARKAGRHCTPPYLASAPVSTRAAVGLLAWVGTSSARVST